MVTKNILGFAPITAMLGLTSRRGWVKILFGLDVLRHYRMRMHRTSLKWWRILSEESNMQGDNRALRSNLASERHFDGLPTH